MPSNEVSEERKWNTNQRCKSLEWCRFLCLIQVEIQWSKEVPRHRFSAGAGSDMWATLTLSILGWTPEGKNTLWGNVEEANVKWRYGGTTNSSVGGCWACGLYCCWSWQTNSGLGNPSHHLLPWWLSCFVLKIGKRRTLWSPFAGWHKVIGRSNHKFLVIHPTTL
jgi:hypothetical protein